jgi:hypothetical protein
MIARPNIAPLHAVDEEACSKLASRTPQVQPRGRGIEEAISGQQALMALSFEDDKQLCPHLLE